MEKWKNKKHFALTEPDTTMQLEYVAQQFDNMINRKWIRAVSKGELRKKISKIGLNISNVKISKRKLRRFGKGKKHYYYYVTYETPVPLKKYYKKYKKYIYILSYDYVRIGKSKHPLHIEVRYETNKKIPEHIISRFNKITDIIIENTRNKRIGINELIENNIIEQEDIDFLTKTRTDYFSYIDENEFELPVYACELKIKGVEIEECDEEPKETYEILSWHHKD